MALKTSVKVGAITNLSDARYCAGMGVDMLGFQAVEHERNYITPAHFQEIRGWFSGPQVVAELYGIRTSPQLNFILQHYQPDMLEVSIEHLDLLEATSLPVIVRLAESEFNPSTELLHRYKDRIHALLLPLATNATQLEHIAQHYPVMVKVTDAFHETILTFPIRGIALEGTPEDKPGLKSYEALASILDVLEED
jgi:phosphoribosylanthranilate isomerase